MKECYVARSRGLAARQLGEEMVIMSAADSTLFNLNEVGDIDLAGGGRENIVGEDRGRANLPNL